MAPIPNQGYRQDLSLQETPADDTALNNIGGAGIAGDLRIIQNNLRNISTIGYSSLTDGFFSFGSDYTFTNDDPLTVSQTITFSGEGIIGVSSTYYVCNSNTVDKFKLSLRPSTHTSGLSIVGFAGTSNTRFNFTRSDKVIRENLVNFVNPPNLMDDDFAILGSLDINGAFDQTLTNVETTNYFITKKYKGAEDTTSNKDIKMEGHAYVKDPLAFNDSGTDLSDAKSPGVFIGDTRAFSSDNNPWSEEGAADGTGHLQTASNEVAVGELNFVNSITVTGISKVSESLGGVTSYSHKMPAIINGETYYLLLKQ